MENTSKSCSAPLRLPTLDLLATVVPGLVNGAQSASSSGAGAAAVGAKIAGADSLIKTCLMILYDQVKPRPAQKPVPFQPLSLQHTPPPPPPPSAPVSAQGGW